MCWTDPLNFRWSRGYICNSSHWHNQIESINLSRCYHTFPLQWRHNERDSVSNHQPYDCLLNRLFRQRSKNTSKLRVTGRCEGNSPVIGEFPAQRASNAKNVSICWRHHAWLCLRRLLHIYLGKADFFQLLMCSLRYVRTIDCIVTWRSPPFPCTSYYHIISIMQTFLKTLNIQYACQAYSVDCVSKIKAILSIIF